MLTLAASGLGDTAQLEEPGPGAAGGAQLRDGRELLVGGGEPHVELVGGGVDVEAGLDEQPQVGGTGEQAVGELLHVGRAGVVHGGGVDDDAARAATLREVRHLDGHRGVGDRALQADAQHGAGVRAERVGAVAGAGRGRHGLVVEHGVERLGGGERVGRVLHHDGREVDEDRLQDAGERAGRDGAVAHAEPQRVGTVLEVGDDLLGGDVGVGVGEPGPHVPAVELAGRRAAARERRLARETGLRQVGREGRGAQRGHADAVERAAGQQTPHVGVGGVVGELLGLAQDSSGGLLPGGDVGGDTVGEGDSDRCLGAHAGAEVGCHRGHRRAGV